MRGTAVRIFWTRLTLLYPGTIVVAKSSGLTFVSNNCLSGASIGEVLVAVVLATVVCAQPLFRNFSLPFEAASEVRMQQPRRQDTLFDCV